MATTKTRVFLAGVGGQGTLTATTVLAKAALLAGLPVTAGEIHGMAQRGGVVESTVLIGGYASPRIGPGEAHLLLGFEPLETLRALPCLAPGGAILSAADPMPPIGVTLGRERYPELTAIKAAAEACAGKVRFLACADLARQAGTALAANTVLLGAAVGLGVLPFDLGALAAGLRAVLNPKILDANLKAAELGAAAVAA